MGFSPARTAGCGSGIDFPKQFVKKKRGREDTFAERGRKGRRRPAGEQDELA